MLWLFIVAAVYIVTTIVVADSHTDHGTDRAMAIAANIARGRLDAGLPAGSLDTVTMGGATYQVISPLPIVPYLLFVPFPFAWEVSRWVISTGIGIAAAWLTLPLARRYGPGGPTTLWLATLGAFGTLLWTQSISGNFYYLAHVEATLCSFIALIEWRGRRRPWVIGLALGLAGLARPTVLLAAIPFGIGLLTVKGDRLRTAVSFLGPLAVAVGLTGLYDALRFGSPLESGYGISVLSRESLVHSRAQGVFSLRHVPNNLALLIVRGFDLQAHFPYLVPDPRWPFDPADVAGPARRRVRRRAVPLGPDPVGRRVPGCPAAASVLRGRRLSNLRLPVRARLHPIPAGARGDRSRQALRVARETAHRSERRLRSVRRRVGCLWVTHRRTWNTTIAPLWRPGSGSAGLRAAV